MARPNVARRRTAAFVGALSAAVLMIAFLPAHAAESGGSVGLEISPGKIERDLTGRGFNYVLTLRNHDDVALDVDLDVTALGHDLDGAPQFPNSKKVEQVVAISQRSFEINPGGSRQIDVEGRIPAGARSIYLGVLATFEPVGGTGTAPSVETRSRVAHFSLIRGPKPWDQRIRVRDIGVLPGEGDDLRVYVTVEGAGNVHVKPRGAVLVKQDGKVIARMALTSETILPGYARRLVGIWRDAVGIDGSVTIEAAFEPPNAAKASRTISFTDGETPKPQAKIANLIAKDEVAPAAAGTPATHKAIVSLDVNNTGDVTLDRPIVTLVAKEGDIERARAVLPQKTLLKGGSTSLRWEPDLPQGTYEITAEVAVGETLLDRSVVGLRLGTVASFDLIGPRRVWVFVAGGLASLVLGALAVFLFRRRKAAKGPGSRPGGDRTEAQGPAPVR